MKKILSQFIAITLVLGTLFLSGCEKDKNKDDSPDLPPISTFTLDLSDFSAQGELKNVDPMSNYHLVVGAVSYWNLVLSVAMVVPVAAYAEAFNHKAERVDNDTWRWSYSVNEDYRAKLIADVLNDSVYLSMKIERTDGAMDEVVWFTGKCDILRTGGEWTVYDVPLASQTPWLYIEWNADYEDNTFDIKYLNVKPEAEYERSYIEYGITVDTEYNAFYNLYNSETNMLYEVAYNTETHVGTVTDGLNQLCWDENFNNTLCGESKVLRIDRLFISE